MTDLEIKAARNSYRVLTGQFTVDEIVFMQMGEIVPFMHNPDRKVTDDTIDNVISVMEELECYECCEILNRIKNEVQGLSGSDNKARVRHAVEQWVSVPVDGSENWQDIDKSRDLPIYWSEESAVSNKEKSHFINYKGLWRAITRLLNRGH